jgi:spore coat protein U-like protein
MKNVLIAALLGLGLAAHGSAFAADRTQNFNVLVSLTPACVLNAVSNITFNYTGMQVSAATGSGGTFSIQCTTNLPYSFSLDADAGGVPGTYQDSSTLLNYTLTTPSAGTGNSSVQPLSLTATMPANQAGSCPMGSACTNGAGTTRTLTITY